MQDYLILNATFDKVFGKGPFSVTHSSLLGRGGQQ
jgi:hypothetical protein